MLSTLGKRLGRVRPEYLVVFLLIVVLGTINFLGAGQRFLLNLYFLPVILAGYLLGVRGGTLAGTASAATIGLFYLLFRPELVPATLPAKIDFWADISLWACVLVVSGATVGMLNNRATAALSDLQRAYQGVLEILVKFIDTADRYTEAHSVRVSILATEIAREMQLPDPEVEDIRVAALLHDVGKIDVSIDVIRKAGKLDDDEWNQLRKHPEHGARIVDSMGGMLKNAVPIILFHHEKFDGTGYYNRAGEQIPLGSRIITAADVFDAMTTDRPYQKARQPWEAIDVIEKGAGSHFDPQVVAAFRSVIQRQLEDIQRAA